MSTYDPATEAEKLQNLGAEHWRAGTTALAGSAGPGVARALSEALRQLNAATGAAGTLADDVAKIMQDPRIPAEGKRQLATEARERVTGGIKAANEQVDSVLDVARAKLRSVAAPKLPKDPATIGLLRDEVRMAVDCSDPHAAALQLAQGDDRELAAVVASPWGQRLLASKGVENAGESLHAAAIAGGTRAGTDTQRAAGAAMDGALLDLQKGRSAFVAGADILLEHTAQY